MMFDLEEVERRKAELQQKKKEAAAKSKLGPQGSPIDDGPQVIDVSQVCLDRDEQWLNSFRLFANVRLAYGVVSEKGKWKIFDEEKFSKVSEARRILLRPYWNKPL